jgi:hypothetical protein
VFSAVIFGGSGLVRKCVAGVKGPTRRTQPSILLVGVLRAARLKQTNQRSLLHEERSAFSFCGEGSRRLSHSRSPSALSMPAAAVVLCDVPRCPGYPASFLRPTCSCGDKVHGNCRLCHVCCARTGGRARPRSPRAIGRGRPRSRSPADDGAAQRRRIDGGEIEDDDESEDEDVVQPATVMLSMCEQLAGKGGAGMLNMREQLADKDDAGMLNMCEQLADEDELCGQVVLGSSRPWSAYLTRLPLQDTQPNWTATSTWRTASGASTAARCDTRPVYCSAEDTARLLRQGASWSACYYLQMWFGVIIKTMSTLCVHGRTPRN